MPEVNEHNNKTMMNVWGIFMIFISFILPFMKKKIIEITQRSEDWFFFCLLLHPSLFKLSRKRVELRIAGSKALFSLADFLAKMISLRVINI